MTLEDEFNKLIKSDIAGLAFGDQLAYLKTYFPSICFSTSFSYEDQVITHLLKEHSEVTVFTLDTGRLFDQTYDTWNLTLAKYGLPIKAYYPDTIGIENFINEHGPDCFYQSVELRKKCCWLRKVAPLKRALIGKQVWITGLRAEHSTNRQSMRQFEWDEDNQIIKFHPLLNWTSTMVEEFIKDNNIPFNPLHKQGYVSIGCSPCTRAIKSGEDFRAGRWWWEDASKKECGLHLKQ